ncbi:MAG: TIGR02301 family protein [Beijerinckiaceae bacterium]|jgi:uncharacterized protein (TIGR02301 family)|nr:TIGR02301 family protein [Beijerinckiaceae bacterium]
MERDSRSRFSLTVELPAAALGLALALGIAPGAAQAQFFQPFWRAAPQPAPPPPPPGYYVVPRGYAPPGALPPGVDGRRPAQRPGAPRDAKRKPKAPGAGAAAVPAKAVPGEAAPPPVTEGPPPPYEPQLMRLSEIMGSLAFLRALCGASDGDAWRARMEALMEAEVTTEPRRERLAGAYNKGYRGFEVTYRTCTPNAEIMIGRYLQEGGKITREISTRYSGG